MLTLVVVLNQRGGLEPSLQEAEVVIPIMKELKPSCSARAKTPWKSSTVFSTTVLLYLSIAVNLFSFSLPFSFLFFSSYFFLLTVYSLLRRRENPARHILA